MAESVLNASDTKAPAEAASNPSTDSTIKVAPVRRRRRILTPEPITSTRTASSGGKTSSSKRRRRKKARPKLETSVEVQAQPVVEPPDSVPAQPVSEPSDEAQPPPLQSSVASSSEGQAPAPAPQPSEVDAALPAGEPAAPAAPKIVDVSKEPPIVQHVFGLSDRAIQRVTGGNAFLRGRLFARRKAVENLSYEGGRVSGEILVRSHDEPYRTSVQMTREEAEDAPVTLLSECTCPGWRGPTGHCKHVAAIIVALRDRFRPPRAKGPANQPKKKKKATPPVHVPQTVSAGGKRRRSRRRRRGRDASGLELLDTGEFSRGAEGRGNLDVWLPADVLPRPLEFEYRLVVRPGSVTVTPVVDGTRNAVPIVEALASFNMISAEERPIFRTLTRGVNRGKPATAELREEDAAELIGLLEGRRVLLEPASMELRYMDEPLVPRIELDRPNGESVRVRVDFAIESTGRRFSLSNGAWFEGTPGWHIDVTQGVARPLADVVTPAWLQRLHHSPALIHATEDMPQLVGEYVPRVCAALGAELPDLAQVADLVDESPQLSIRCEGDIVEAFARLSVIYDDQEFDIPPASFPSPLAFLPPSRQGGRPRVVRRDVGLEMAAVQRVLGLGFEVDESGTALVAHGEEAIAFWTGGLGELPEEWDRYVPDDLASVTIRESRVSPRARVSSGVDWLSLSMTFDAGGVVVAEDELRACLEHGRHIVKLEDGTYAPVDPDEVAGVLERMAEIYATGGRQKKLPLSQAGRVQGLLEMVGQAKVTTSAKQLFDKLGNLDSVPSIAKPRTLKAKLRPYQKEGFSWLVFLHQLGSGGILADDMGLGKTVEAIALLTWAKTKHKRKLNLVVAPTSVVPNWEREIAKFAPGLKTVIWQGQYRHKRRDELADADVMITSYALLRRDEELLAELDLRYVILDEAQHIKNPMSQTARAAKKLPSDRRLALTGTPIENRLSEIWSIMDFVSPGLLGKLKDFEEKVARPIDRGDEATARKLRSTIQPFVLRRTKSEVAKDLPEKIQQEIVVPLAETQSTLYKQIVAQVRKSVLSEVQQKGIAKSHIQILAALTRLRQVACDPRLMKLEDTEFENADSGKLAALREIVAEAIEGGHRVLVFSQFVSMLTLIRAALEEDGVTYEYLDGSTKDRIGKVDHFNDDESVPVFLISLKAGGTGLNLTGADTVIHFDPWWNPAVEDQATDRAHRIGQTKVVTVYRLIAEGTVEEKILQLSAKKRALVSNVLSTEGSPLKGLTRADVDDLFS
ncbi:MAG: DEAD/DEAH box helicase family protein [Deltaproteobacteria bacterium]|nr:DEAD/DEAH box helicase family protein [Deltaproteobacteria bacterium]